MGSLDLSNKAGVAWNTAAYAPALLADGLSLVTAATFDSSDADSASKYGLQVDTSLGDVDLATLPTTMLAANGSELLVDGTSMCVIKATTDTNRLVFTDPITGALLDFANLQIERMGLTFSDDGTTREWVFLG